MSIFSKSLISFNPTIFGLDICDRSIKMAELQQSRKKIELKSYSYGEIANGLVDNGEIKDAAKVGEIIKKVMATARPRPITTKNVICSVVESRCFVRVAKIPLMDEEDLEDAINLEAEEYFPLAREEMYIDWQIINKIPAANNGKGPVDDKETKLEVLLGAVPKLLVDSYLEAMANSGLNPVAIEIEPVATARCLVSKDYSDKNILIIDLGGQRTSFFITKGDTVYFTSGISTFCGDILSVAISKELKVSIEDAIQIKNTCGFDYQKLEGKVFRILNAHINELIVQTRRVLSYFVEHNIDFVSNRSGSGISKIILCGGGANLIGLDIFLAQQLRIPVEIGNPWVNIIDKKSKKIPLISREKSLYFSTALGLAMRGLK